MARFASTRRRGAVRIVVNPRGGQQRSANPAQVMRRSGVAGHHPTAKDPRVYAQYPVTYGEDEPTPELLPMPYRYSRRGTPVTRNVYANQVAPLKQVTGYDTYPPEMSAPSLKGARQQRRPGLGVWYDPRTWNGGAAAQTVGGAIIPGTSISFDEAARYWPQIKQSISIMDWLPGKFRELDSQYVAGLGSPAQRAWWESEARPKFNQIQGGWDNVVKFYNLARQYVPGLSGVGRNLNQDRRPLALAVSRRTGLGFDPITISIFIIVLLVIALAVAIYKMGFDAGEEGSRTSGSPGSVDIPEVIPDNAVGGPGGPGARGGGGGGGRGGRPSYGPGVNNMFWFKAGTVDNPAEPLRVAEPAIANFSDKPKIHAFNSQGAGGGRVVFSNPEMEVREYVEGEAGGPMPLARNTGKRVEKDWWITPGWDADVPLINNEWEQFGGDALNAVLIGGGLLIAAGLFFRFVGGIQGLF